LVAQNKEKFRLNDDVILPVVTVHTRHRQKYISELSLMLSEFQNGITRSR